MSRIALTSALFLAVLTSGALAQANSAPLPPPVAATPDDGAPPPPPGAPGQRPPPPGGPHAMGPGGPSDDPRGRRPPPGRAAHFRIEHGDLSVDVKCAEDEPMRACADLTLQMIDRLQATTRY